MGMHQSAGGEYCSLQGARKLLRRIEAVRKAQGIPCNLMLARVAADRSGHAVYGLRERTASEAVIVRDAPRVRYTGWHTEAKAICERTLAALHPDVTLADVLGPARQRYITAARHNCIRACLAEEIADTIPALARFFNVTEMVIWRCQKSRPSRSRECVRAGASV